MDNFELIDNDLSTVGQTGRIHSNLIRLKKSSFTEISKKWTNFRIARLNKKLEKAEAELENVVDNTPMEKMEEKLLAKSKKVANIERKIKMLAREEVPSNYVSNRAIKLKEAMMNEVRGVSEEVYSDNKEVTVPTDNAVDYGFTDFDSTDFAMASTNTNEDNRVINRDEIRNSIDEIYAGLNANNNQFNEIVAGTNEVKETPVNEIVNETSEVKETPVNEIVNETNEVEETPVNEVVNETNNDENPSFDIPVSPIEREDIEKVINGSIDSEKEEDYGSLFKASTNGSSPAMIGKYSDAVMAAENVYRPMTEEDLLRARANIEYDRYNGITDDDKQLRDDINVVPDRVEDNEYTFVEDNEEEMHFDYTDATAKDLENALSFETSSSGLQAMIARADKLKAEQEKTNVELAEARRLQEEEAKRALEIKEELARKEKERTDYMSRFNDYLTAMESSVESNKSAIAAATEDAKTTREYIKSQEMMRDMFDREIDEIRSVISPDTGVAKIVTR